MQIVSRKSKSQEPSKTELDIVFYECHISYRPSPYHSNPLSKSILIVYLGSLAPVWHFSISFLIKYRSAGSD